MEEPERVGERRAGTGLGALAEAAANLRRQAAAEGARPPADYAARQREIDSWARRVG